ATGNPSEIQQSRREGSQHPVVNGEIQEPALVPPDQVLFEFSGTEVRIQQKPDCVLQHPEQRVTTQGHSLQLERPNVAYEKWQVEEKQDRAEGPQVVAGEWPATIEKIQQDVAVNFPSWQAGRPAISAFDLNF